MANVMCAQNLWTVVRRWNVGAGATDSATGLLGSWAASRFQEDDIDVVVAISDSTYMTIVLPLGSPLSFHADFRAAVGAALQDLRVPAARIAVELSALDMLFMSRLCDASLRSVLNDLRVYCGLEFLYHSDIRTVQRNLNDVPHSSLAGGTPAHAVNALLGGRREDVAH